MELEVNEEILVVYFIGKAKCQERFFAWCSDKNSELKEKCIPFSVLI